MYLLIRGGGLVGIGGARFDLLDFFLFLSSVDDSSTTLRKVSLSPLRELVAQRFLRVCLDGGGMELR